VSQFEFCRDSRISGLGIPSEGRPESTLRTLPPILCQSLYGVAVLAWILGGLIDDWMGTLTAISAISAVAAVILAQRTRNA
jgi:hypothetical protein